MATINEKLKACEHYELGSEQLKAEDDQIRLPLCHPFQTDCKYYRGYISCDYGVCTNEQRNAKNYQNKYRPTNEGPSNS